MAQTKIFEIPGKLSVSWDSEAKAIIDSWVSYGVTKNEFSNAVLNKGLAHARANGGIAYIVDSSQATGTFSQEIQDFIPSNIFPAFANAKIKYFITIPAKSATTNIGIKRFSSSTGPLGLQLVNVDSLASATAWLKQNARQHAH